MYTVVTKECLWFRWWKWELRRLARRFDTAKDGEEWAFEVPGSPRVVQIYGIVDRLDITVCLGHGMFSFKYMTRGELPAVPLL